MLGYVYQTSNAVPLLTLVGIPYIAAILTHAFTHGLLLNRLTAEE